jgi:carbon storage regulator
MLVLSRKAGESIEIGGGITITVLHVGSGRVKIGVSAPASVAVQRGELRAENPCPARGEWTRPRSVLPSVAFCIPNG